VPRFVEGTTGNFSRALARGIKIIYFMRLNPSEEIVLPELVWKKPVVCIFKERYPTFEVDPFVVVKAKALSISNSAGKFTGTLADFFTLMGDADYLSTAEGVADRYVMCWFDDAEPNQTKDLRRLKGVSFTSKVTFVINEGGKRTYNADFKAEHAKLK
jgi:hypothetical protein